MYRRSYRQRNEELLLDLYHLKCLENVALLDVVEALKSYSALVARVDLTNIILEAAQSGYLILEYNDTVAYNTYLSASCDLTVEDIRACNRSDVRYVDSLTDLCVSEQIFLELRSKHTLHSRLNLFNAFVDYAIGTYIDLLTLCGIESVFVGTYIKAYDNGI